MLHLLVDSADLNSFNNTKNYSQNSFVFLTKLLIFAPVNGNTPVDNILLRSLEWWNR